MADFAKVLRLEDGTQALFYVEVDGETQIFHQVFAFDWGQVDAKVEQIDVSEEKQQEWLDLHTPESAMELKRFLTKYLGL